MQSPKQSPFPLTIEDAIYYACTRFGVNESKDIKRLVEIKDIEYEKLIDQDRILIASLVTKVRSHPNFIGGEINEINSPSLDLSILPFENILTIPVLPFLTQFWTTMVILHRNESLYTWNLPMNPWDVQWGVSNAPGKRRRALFFVFNFNLEGGGFNNLFFAWSMKAKMGLDVVRCIDKDHIGLLKAPNTDEALDWLKPKDLEEGDSMFLFADGHGVGGLFALFTNVQLVIFCETLPRGVNIFICTDACDVYDLAKTAYHYTTDVDGSLNPDEWNSGSKDLIKRLRSPNSEDALMFSKDDFILTPYAPYASRPMSTKTVANVVTLTEHHAEVLSGAGCNTLHMYTFGRRWTGNFWSYLWNNANGIPLAGRPPKNVFRTDMTWAEIVLGFTDEYTGGGYSTIHPVIGLSIDGTLAARNFLFP